MRSSLCLSGETRTVSPACSASAGSFLSADEVAATHPTGLKASPSIRACCSRADARCSANCECAPVNCQTLKYPRETGSSMGV